MLIQWVSGDQTPDNFRKLFHKEYWLHKIASALHLCASSYFYLVVSWEMTRGNYPNGKHDEWKFAGLNIVWVGTRLDGIFWIRVIRVVIFWVGISWVGVILGGKFPDGNCPS